MTNAVTQIENAMVQQLRTVARDYPGLVVESYAGQLDDELFAWVRTLPATWVTFSGLTEYKRLSVHAFKAHGKFEVLIAQRDLSENAGRLNAPAAGRAVGAYALLDDNKRALVNQQLGLAIQPFTPGPIRAVMKSMVNREAIVVYAQEFSCEWQEVFQDEPASPAGELQTIGASYYLKPQRDVQTDPADKTDVVATLTI
jgi:phage gp37-like protein